MEIERSISLYSPAAASLPRKRAFRAAAGTDLTEANRARLSLSQMAQCFFGLAVCDQVIGTTKQAFRDGESNGGRSCVQGFFETLRWQARRRSGRGARRGLGDCGIRVLEQSRESLQPLSCRAGLPGCRSRR